MNYHVVKLARVLSWVVLIILIIFVGSSLFYFFKPVSLGGHNCTFDNFNCESNTNILAAFGYMAIAIIAGIIFSVIRLIIWLSTRSRKHH